MPGLAFLRSRNRADRLFEAAAWRRALLIFFYAPQRWPRLNSGRERSLITAGIPSGFLECSDLIR